MRITRSSRAYNMGKVSKYDDDLFESFPCLHDLRTNNPDSLYLDVSFVSADIEIGWGKQWGCKENVDKWNTNWPRWNQCATLICPNATDGSDRESLLCSSCSLDEESSKMATLACMNKTFNFTLVEA